MGEDGWVSIKLDLETKNFDAEIKKSEGELEKLRAKEAELIKLNERFNKDTKNGGRFVVSTEEYNRMQKLGITMEDIGNKDTFLKLQSQIEGTSNKILNLQEKQRKLNDSANFEGMNKGIDNVGKGISKAIKKVVKWTLAVVSLRSVYLGIRSAMGILTEQDDGLKARVDYLRFVLANSLKPIIEWIVNAMYTLLGIIRDIFQLLFGINIFENASVKAYKNANKEAKKLKNTIASFDEMNVLSDNSDKETALPTQDLSKLGELPEWLKFIEKIKDFISEIAPIIAIIFAILFKIKKLGLYIAIYGIYKTFKEIKNWLKEPTFENFLGVLEGIAITVAGIAIAFGAWPVAMGAALALIVFAVIKNWDTIKETIMNVVIKIGDWLEIYFGIIGRIIGDVFTGIVAFIIRTFDGIIQPIKKIYDGIIKITQGDFAGGISDIFGGLIDSLTWPFRAFADFIGTLWDSFIKRPIETLVNKIKKALGFQVDMQYKFSAGGGGGGSIGGGGGGGGFDRAKGGVFYPSKLPKLAVGGIINKPGPGVAYNGAYIGERGAEAVVPLTDSQQMELLGSTIGRYVNIQLTSNLDIDGRLLARKVDKVQQNNNFVLNR